MADVAGSSGSGNKFADRMARLKELHNRRQESRKANHAEVVEEDRRSKLPANHEAKELRQAHQLETMEKRKACEAAGVDYDRTKLLGMQADDADRVDAAKRRKKNPDEGFTTYDAMTLRQYTRDTRAIKPDVVAYEEMKSKMGEEFYPNSGTLLINSHYPDKAGMDRMSTDLRKQMDKRAKYSRHRTFDADAPVDFINERNRKFNQKVARFYNKYTEEIKQNIERGTAV